MRNLILLFCLFSFTVSAYAQKTPDSVLEAFEKKYPGSEVLEWEFFEGKYTASFFEKDNYVVSIFDVKGNWIQSTTQITEEQLPRKVKKCWNKKFKDIQFVTAILSVQKHDSKPEYHLSFESSKDLVNLVYNRRGRIKKKFSEPILMD